MSSPSLRSVRFRYRAATQRGRIVRGSMEGRDQGDVVRRLAEDGLTAIRVSPTRPPLFARRVAARDLAVAFRNVATLTASGVPIERAVAVSEQLVSSALAGRLSEVRRMLRQGSSVAEALRSMPDVFPRSLVGVIEAGERGSALGPACESVAEQLEADAELRAQIRSALAYPLLIAIMGLATIGVMTGLVIPRFAIVLEELGAELPTATRLLLSASAAVRRLGVPAAIAGVAAVPLLHALLRQDRLRLRVDRFLLRVPFLGSVRLGFASARTCRAIGAMLTNGMPLLAAMDSAAEATGDLEIARRLGNARAAVARGGGLTQALSEQRVLTALALQLVGVGEASSTLGPMMSRAGDLAARHTERTIRTAVTMLEPALVIGLGVAVAMTAAALLQAVYSVRPA